MAKKQKKIDEISKKFGEERQKALDNALKRILVREQLCAWGNELNKKFKS